MRLILIRHGQTQSNIDRLLDTGYPGAPLTPQGQAQAQSLVARLADEPIQAVYASDLLRAQQTAAPLAAQRGLPVHSHPGLREIYVGVDDMAADWRPYVAVLDSWGDTPDNCLPGGENAIHFFGRFDAAVAEIEATGVGCAALVSHGAAMWVWASVRSDNLDPETVRDWRLDNTDVVVMSRTGQGWDLVRWGDLSIDPS